MEKETNTPRTCMKVLHYTSSSQQKGSLKTSLKKKRQANTTFRILQMINLWKVPLILCREQSLTFGALINLPQTTSQVAHV